MHIATHRRQTFLDFQFMMALLSLFRIAVAFLFRAHNLKTASRKIVLLTGILSILAGTPALAVPSTPLPNAIVGQRYLLGLPSPFPDSYSATFESGNLPPAVAVSSNGTLDGTPTLAGTYTFSVKFTYMFEAQQTVTYTLVVGAAGLTITPATLPNGEVGEAYNQMLMASDGTDPYSFEISAGTLPDGLTQLGGTISGTPTVSGTYTFTVTATDSSSPNMTGDIDYTLTIDSATLEITPEVEFLDAGTVGETYSYTIGATGGLAPYTFAIEDGALPSGLSMDSTTGAITGTPIVSGTFEFTVAATDSGGGTPGTGSASFKIVIAPAALAITPAIETVPVQTGTAHNKVINASGGTSPYTFQTSGTLPPGLSLQYDGELAEIAGTPTAIGAYVFQVMLTDVNLNSTSATYNYVVMPKPPLMLTPSSGGLPQASVGVAYQQVILASGGASPYSFAISSGSLPAGLSLNQGVISGTPTTAGTYAFTVTATDNAETTSSADYTIFVAGTQSHLTLTPSGGALPDAMVGEDYQQPITASGGTDPVIYSLASGELPKGLILNISTGELNGPLALDAVAGDYSFTILAADAGEKSTSGSFTLKVNPRAVTAPDQAIVVPSGSTPPNVYLNRGATGGPFTLAQTTFVEPANAGTATIIRGQLAAAGPIDEPIGWYLQFKPNPAFTGTAKVGYRLVSALGTSNTGTISYKLIADAEEVVAEIDGLVRGFVNTRQGLISSTINVPGLLDRRMVGVATEPVSVTASPSGEGMLLGFASSLAQVESARDAAEGIIRNEPNRFNVWIDGALLAHKRDENAGKWGSFGIINTGADYLLSERLLLGLSFHYDRMSDPTDADAKLTGNGWLVGPYASIALGEKVFWDTSLRYGGSSNDIDTAFWDGEFDTTRWLIDTAIKGQWLIGENTILTPKLRAVYFNEKVEDYSVRDASGNEIGIGGFDIEQFRASLGAEIARSFTLGNGTTFTPKFGATFGYAGLDESGAFGSLTAGVSVQTGNAFTVDGSVLFNLSDGGAQSVGARATLSKRF